MLALFAFGRNVDRLAAALIARRRSLRRALVEGAARRGALGFLRFVRAVRARAVGVSHRVFGRLERAERCDICNNGSNWHCISTLNSQVVSWPERQPSDIGVGLIKYNVVFLGVVALIVRSVVQSEIIIM